MLYIQCYSVYSCIVESTAFLPKLSYLVVSTMGIGGSLHVITTGEWNLSQYSSFLQNTDAKMGLPGWESNNVRMDFNKTCKKKMANFTGLGT